MLISPGGKYVGSTGMIQSGATWASGTVVPARFSASWTRDEYLSFFMIKPVSDLIARAKEYAKLNEFQIEGEFGFGIDGHVFKTSRRSALKVFEQPDGYRCERDVYLRLHENHVARIGNHSVPELLQFDNRLCLVEMSVVRPPYVLDFAKSRLDSPPDFSQDVIEQWQLEKREQFGDRWEEVLFIMALLKSRYGIYLTDVNPGNITFAENQE